MRKITIISLFLLILLLSTNVFAADLIWRLTHGDQYALILGTVEQVDEGWIKVNVSKILNGKQVGKSIEIFADENRTIEPKFYWYVPKEGDFVVVSIDKDNSKYILKLGIRFHH